MLTRKLAIQALADERAGLPSRYPTSQFPEPFRTLRAALQAHGPAGCEREWLLVLLEAPDGKRILEELSAAQIGAQQRSLERAQQLAEGGGAAGVGFAPLAELAAELPPVSWLWRGWIPRGFISLLGARPGVGKSLVALDLARRVIAAEGMPDGQAAEGEGDGYGARRRVLYVDAEVVPQLAVARAAAWGMNLERLFMLLPEPGRYFIDFTAAADRDRLTEMVYALEPALIVVDSLSSITSGGENAVDDIREVLGFLNQVAQIQPCGLLLIHHLRKRSAALPASDELTIDDFRGSSHIIAMSRSVLGLSRVRASPQRDRNGPRRLEVVKTNLGPAPEPLGVTFEPLGAPRSSVASSAGAPGELRLPDAGVRLVYGTAPQQFRPQTKAEACADLIVGLLADGALSPKAVVAAAQEAGYSRDTVYRARKALEGRVRNTAGWKNSDGLWELVG